MGGSNRGHFLSALAGGLIAVLLTAVVPAVAGNGDPMYVGQKNNATRATKLTSRGGLHLSVGKPGNPALILNVAGGTPPLQVNSSTLVDLLNADLLDGSHAAGFASSGQACTEEGSSVVGIDASGAIECLVGGATTTTEAAECAENGDCPVCMVCDGGECSNAVSFTDPKNDCGGYFCSGSGVCLGTCSSSAECKGGFVCDVPSCVVGECVEDSDCPQGYACTDNVCEPT